MEYEDHLLKFGIFIIESAKIFNTREEFKNHIKRNKFICKKYGLDINLDHIIEKKNMGLFCKFGQICDTN